ncbi:MAG: hypothetical protein CMJ21_04630 [Phycisphaerae bacterium]|nr:hypothetical protein [Phycisphaerae bacterium]
MDPFLSTKKAVQRTGTGLTGAQRYAGAHGDGSNCTARTVRAPLRHLSFHWIQPMQIMVREGHEKFITGLQEVGTGDTEIQKKMSRCGEELIDASATSHFQSRSRTYL